jgi:hypothetical protein
MGSANTDETIRGEVRFRVRPRHVHTKKAFFTCMHYASPYACTKLLYSHAQKGGGERAAPSSSSLGSAASPRGRGCSHACRAARGG